LKRHLFSLPVILTALIAAIIVQSSCRENTLIRSKVLPANDTVGLQTYTLPCITHTYYDPNAITSTDIGGIPIYQGVGVYTDSFFGTMTGSTYFNVTTNDYYNVFTNMTVDSAVLLLPYGGFTFGDSTNQSLTQTYLAFYMLDTLGNPNLVTYYANSTKPVDFSDPLSDAVTVNLHQLKDSFGYNSLAINAPALRMKLRLPALFKHLNPALNILATSSNPTQDFLNAFNGLCVMPANTRQGTTAIPYFQLDGTNTYNEAGILVYYHDPVGWVAGDTDFIEQYYFAPSICSHFNNITRSYSRYPVNNLLHSSAVNDSIIALQNQPGASLDVIIPGIKSLPVGVINNAQLQIHLLPGYNTDTTLLPERMYPIGIGSSTYPSGTGAGVEYNLADRYPVTSLSPLAFMDGFYHPLNVAGVSQRAYTINLPREVLNSIAARNDTIHLHISGTQDYYGAFKMLAGGGAYADTNYRPKLIVVYSKLNN
jgi:hypothetical protein